MTWLQCKRAVLRKLFASPEGTPELDEGTRAYLAALPAVAAEGMALLGGAGKGEVKQLVIDHAPGQEEMALMCYDLAALAPDFGSVEGDGIWLWHKGRLLASPPCVLAGRAQLWLQNGLPGQYTVCYRPALPELDEQTPDDYRLPLGDEAAAALVLYAASQLYKDEDAALASAYRGEFEAALPTLPGPHKPAGSFYSESGWA